MVTTFRELAELCEKLEATSKRLVTVNMVADFLKQVEPKETEPAVSMILGRPFPIWSPQTLEVSWATLSEIIRRITSVEWDLFHKVFSESGDIGSATRTVFENSKVKKQSTLFERTLTMMEVRQSFQSIAAVAGYGSREKKERLVETLLSRATPLEAKYFVKIFIGDMRTGFSEGLMEQAVSEAFCIPLKEVQRATMILGDVGEVGALIRTSGREGLLRIGFRIFRPVRLMLAQMAENVAEALEEHGGMSAFEYKFDGARVQVHESGGKIRIFSRRLTDVTESLPEISRVVEDGVKAKEAILEGEVVAIDDTGHPIPFQHLMRRFRRVHSIEEMAERIPVRLYLFDVLYLDGRSLISLPYTERRRVLAEATSSIELAKQVMTSNADDGERFLKEAMAAGHEGLMAKKPDSPYTPGIRGKRWLKIKPVLEPLDLVIVAAEWGYGRRHEWLSDYYLAARDAKTGEFLSVGKTFKGLTDAEMIEMTKRLKKLTIEKQPGRATVIPRIVVEVTYNEVQQSPKYKSGMALRFARISRIRDDKTPEEADTIQRVREIYERQFLKKGRYRAG